MMMFIHSSLIGHRSAFLLSSVSLRVPIPLGVMNYQPASQQASSTDRLCLFVCVCVCLLCMFTVLVANCCTVSTLSISVRLASLSWDFNKNRRLRIIK